MTEGRQVEGWLGVREGVNDGGREGREGINEGGEADRGRARSEGGSEGGINKGGQGGEKLRRGQVGREEHGVMDG